MAEQPRAGGSPEVIEEVVTVDTRLSVGDALAIAALLVFAVGWLVMWAVLNRTAYGTDTDVEKLSAMSAVMLLIAFFGPPLWAMGHVGRIVRRHS